MPKHKTHPKIKCPRCGHTFTHGAPPGQLERKPLVYAMIALTILAVAAYACTYVF